MINWIPDKVGNDKIDMVLILIAVELGILFVLSRRLTQNFFIAVFLLTKSRPVAVSFLSILFFPGTVIHELSHLFTAEILGVRTGGLTLVPEGIEQKDLPAGKAGVRTGSVSVAQSDPFRRAAIGIAPIIVGLISLGVLSYFLSQQILGINLSYFPRGEIDKIILAMVVLLFYLIFAVSNTMFASKEDLEGFWPLMLVLGLLAAAAYITGIRVTLTDPVLSTVTAFFQSVAVNLGYVTALNVTLVALSAFLIRGVEKITKRRVSSPPPPDGRAKFS